MTDSYQRHWMQWASSEPGPLGLPALLKTLPCALSWNTKKKQKKQNKHEHIKHTLEGFSLMQDTHIKTNCTADGFHTCNLLLSTFLNLSMCFL